MEKVNDKKTLKHLYTASAKEVVQVQVPPMKFLMVDGQGDPNTAQSYKDAIEALFSVFYTLKFLVKKRPLGLDYAVMPLESLWWADDMRDFGTADKSNWKWTAMVTQPPVIAQALVQKAMAEVQRKKRLPALAKLRFEHIKSAFPLLGQRPGGGSSVVQSHTSAPSCAAQYLQK